MIARISCRVMSAILLCIGIRMIVAGFFWAPLFVFAVFGIIWQLTNELERP